TCEESSDTGQLLDRLVLPSLRKLDISPPLDDNALRRLGDRSSCNLIHLGMIDNISEDTTIVKEDPPSYLEAPCVQTIRSLHIGPLVVDAFFHHLTWKCNTELGNHYLPHLKELSVRAAYTTDGVASQMVASRWGTKEEVNQPASLTSVKLDLVYVGSRRTAVRVGITGRHYHNQDQKVLSELEAAGLVLQLYCCTLERLDSDRLVEGAVGRTVFYTPGGIQYSSVLEY
ncbi:hypothetical protein C0991_010872, partial [Blastosporella zonata]